MLCGYPLLISAYVYGFVEAGTREASFMSAIVAAGVAHAVTRECAKGNISSCSCDKSNEGKRSAGGWKWGGCSDDIEYGIEISNKFLATPRRMIEKRFELQNRQNSIVAHEVRYPSNLTKYK